ncbi:MFS transporter [Kribbella sp. NPDC056861]|uniref:MFS transporter n=1 Tax=Kribbella sp. NPDC056861 TaxID=3154857 RepID=UPI00343B8DBB
MATSQTETSNHTPPTGASNKLPWSALLALSTAAFIGILTEALPAGVLPEMARDLSVSESAAGQMLTIYAIATGVSAIPLMVATAAWGRKQLLLLAVSVIAVANVVTAISSSYALTMTFRLLAGIAAAAVWAELVGYALRLAPPHLQGRAISITMAGVPLALALGIPVGTFLGNLFGWRLTFGLVAALSVLLLVWISVSVPAAPGQKLGQREPILKALKLPGVVAVLFTVAAWVLAHNVLYTYISTFLDEYGMGGQRDTVLLTFGIASVVSIVITGAMVDRKLRQLTIGSAAFVIIAAIGLGLLASSDLVVYAAIVLWGLGWGGVTTLLQTAVTDAGGTSAQALLVTTWNSFMAGGGAVGGILLASAGPSSFPWAVLALMVPVLLVVVISRKHGFPVKRPSLH